jgi:hypothetical protein
MTLYQHSFLYRPKYAGVSRTAAVGELPVFSIIIRVLGIQDGVELNLRVV